jgi:hypothetical protein
MPVSIISGTSIASSTGAIGTLRCVKTPTANRNCEEARARISDGIRGGEPTTDVEVTAHLDNCDACSKELAAISVLWSQLGKLDAPHLTDESAAAMLAKLNHTAQTRFQSDRRAQARGKDGSVGSRPSSWPRWAALSFPGHLLRYRHSLWLRRRPPLIPTFLLCPNLEVDSTSFCCTGPLSRRLRAEGHNTRNGPTASERGISSCGPGAFRQTKAGC